MSDKGFSVSRIDEIMLLSARKLCPSPFLIKPIGCNSPSSATNKLLSLDFFGLWNACIAERMAVLASRRVIVEEAEAFASTDNLGAIL